MATGYGKARCAKVALEGARTAKAGGTPEDCPYTVDSDEFYERHDARYWIMGFTAAQRVIARRARTAPAPT